jgi:NAD(P)-dependent dehydrogenase (short-subunit alcohol dehydrogenase family)
MNVLITGANRGLGFAMTRRFVDYGDHVIATARRPAQAVELAELALQHPDRVTVVELDVTDEAQCVALSESCSSLDLLINNAGIDSGFIPFDAVDLSEAKTIYDVDALGPFRVTRALVAALEPSGVVMNISSRLASITNDDGGSLPYRMAKAALNMQSHTLAMELRDRGIVVVAVSPGWVRTDMGGAAADLCVDDSAERLVALARTLSIEQSGRFLDRFGREIPW